MEEPQRNVCDFEGLTLGPGGPTLPAAPGKPVTPYNGGTYFCLEQLMQSNIFTFKGTSKY